MPKQIWLPTTETRVTVENGTVRIIDYITMTAEQLESKPLGFDKPKDKT